MVPALGRHTRGDEVAHSGEARKCRRASAHGNSEAGHLNERTCHQHRDGVETESETLRHAGGERHHVLQSPGTLGTDYIGVGVDAESWTHEQRLHLGRCLFVLHGDHGRCGLTSHDLSSEIRTGENADMGAIVIREHVEGDLGHAHQGRLFDSLGEGENRRLSGEQRCSVFENRSIAVGRHTHHNGVGVFDCTLDARCGNQFGWELETGEIVRIRAVVYALGQLHPARPQDGFACGSEHGRDSRSP